MSAGPDHASPAAEPRSEHRLDGLEPDNLLAFLALLGLLRALEAADGAGEQQKLHPRVSWSIDCPPLRPVLHLRPRLTRQEVCELAVAGVNHLVGDHDFDGRVGLDYTKDEAQRVLENAVRQASAATRNAPDLFSALMSDGALKDQKGAAPPTIDPTPLCLMFGQGWQHFLDRLAKVPAEPAPPPRGRGKSQVTLTAEQCLEEALFELWHRDDPTFSFRWDPEEDVRYALLAGDPTASAYKAGTQHGANRLAAIGLAALTVAPETRAGRVRTAVLGGDFGGGGFSLAWPVWRAPASLAAIRAMLGHPDLRAPGALAHLGVEDVLVAKRIPVGKFMNFTRARSTATA